MVYAGARVYEDTVESIINGIEVPKPLLIG